MSSNAKSTISYPLAQALLRLVWFMSIYSLFTFELLGPIGLVLTRIVEGMRPRATKEETAQ
jgi:hypothetical protein